MTSMLLGVVGAILLWAALRPRAWPWRLGPPLPEGPAHRRHPAGDGRSRSAPVGGNASEGPDAVPPVADLLAVTAASGAPMAQCLAEAGSIPDAPAPVRAAVASLSRGNGLDDVLGELSDCGAGWHSLATIVSLSSGAGSGGADALRRFAHSERLRLRRERERRARRLPVLLLLPLTTMVLPAFALSTVVPFVVLGDNPLDLPPIPTIPEGP